MITLLKYGRTVSRGKGTFEFERVDAEATLDAGQTPESGFAALKAFVDEQVTAALVGSPAAEKAAEAKDDKPAPKAEAKSTDPPLGKSRGKGKKADPPPATADSGTTASSPSPSQDATSSSAPAPAGDKPPAKRGRPPKSKVIVPGVDEILATLGEATTVPALLDKFNEMRAVADRSKGEAVDAWETVCKTVAGAVRSIPGYGEAEGYEEFTKAMKAEAEAIAITRE